MFSYLLHSLRNAHFTKIKIWWNLIFKKKFSERTKLKIFPRLKAWINIPKKERSVFQTYPMFYKLWCNFLNAQWMNGNFWLGWFERNLFMKRNIFKENKLRKAAENLKHANQCISKEALF